MLRTNVLAIGGLVAVLAAFVVWKIAIHEPQRVVEGEVTYRGNPISSGTISFEPLDQADSRPLIAEIHNGRYQLSADAIHFVAGQYLVRIWEFKSTEDLPPKLQQAHAGFARIQTLPKHHNQESTLTVELDHRSENSKDFHLPD